LSEEQRRRPQYSPDNHNFWTIYFDRRHEDLIASSNGVIPRGRHNAEGRREWWGVPGRTLEYVLGYIEAGNTPRLEYPAPAPPPFSRRRGSSWMPRRLSDATTSSSSGGSPAPFAVKPEPQETAPASPLGRRTRSGAAPEEGRGGRLRLVRPKPEPEPVKPEHLAMAAADETAMRWAREDYVREQVARQRRALEELKARQRRPVREVDGVLVLDSDDEEEAGPSRVGDPGQGCSRDGGGWQDDEDEDAFDDDDDDDGDYTTFYKRLGM
jgi:hypothetical protein